MKTKIYTLILVLASFPGWAQDEWMQTNGPSGGEVFTISASPLGYLYASTLLGVYRSSDSGNSWSLLEFPLGRATTAVNASGDVFAASGNIYRSTDAGNTWDSVATGSGFFTNISINSTGTIYAGNVSWQGLSLLISYDNGDTWMQQSLNIGIADNMVVGANSLGYIYIGIDNGLYRSTDEGVTFEAIGSGVAYVKSILITPDDDLFVGCSFGQGIYRSEDHGNTMEQVLADHDVSSLAYNDSFIFAGTESGVYRSANNGDSWEPVNNGLTETNILSLAADFQNNIYVGSFGIFRSADNGDTCTAAYTGIAANRIFSLDSNQEGDLFALADGVYLTSDNGETCSRVNDNIRGQLYQSILVHSNGDIYAPDKISQGLYRSEDNGETWTNLLNDTILFNPYDVAINQEGAIFVVGLYGVLRSQDNGVTWTNIYNGMSCDLFTSIAINDSGYIFIGSHTCNVIFRSTDNGETWSEADTPDPETGITAIYVNSVNTVFAATERNVIFRSMDNGESWVPLSMPIIPNHAILDLDFDENNNIYAASYVDGIFRSTNNGETWESINEGLTYLILYSIEYTNDGILFAGTSGASVWRLDINVKTNNTPASTHNILIYPNPATSVINISNHSPSVSRYQIINEYGQLVSSGSIRQGLNSIDINMLVNGVYLLKVYDDRRVDVKKFLVTGD